MASGGSENRHSRSEPRNRSMFSRLLNSEEDSINLLGSTSTAQDRLNNWDFSNWQPSSKFDGTTAAKQPKRANEEKESKNRKKIGKENIGAAVGESPQGDGGKPHRTPSTFPRTKVTPVMPMSQRIALENLRQHMTFSDVDEMSIEGVDRDGERNNQRLVPRRERPVEMSLERNEVGGATNKNTEPSRDNRNPNRHYEEDDSEEPDSTQIVGRLMQIRDYIKQASSMMERLQSSGDPSDQGRASQLDQVINRLKDQEEKYLELLLKLSTAKEEGLLMRQNSLPLPEGGSNNMNSQLEADYPANNNNINSQVESEYRANSNNINSQVESEYRANSNNINSQVESESEAATELEVCTDTSENEEPEENDDGRPRIEDKLGQQSSDAEEYAAVATSRTDSRFSGPVTPELDSTLVSETAEAAAADLMAKRHDLESDLSRKNDELDALKEQHDLLRKMLEQKEQLRGLQTRQAALVMMQQEAEERLAEEQEPGSSNAAGGDSVSSEPEGDDPELGPQELLELKMRLDYLKNLYQMTSEAEEDNIGVASADTRKALTAEKAQLQDKLSDLQQKKSEMDRLLSELQGMSPDARGPLNNEVDLESTSSSRINEGIAATAAANQATDDSPSLMEMMESRNKLKKLQEVKDRLSQLKGLVQYYQSGQDFIHSDSELPEPPTAVPATRPAAVTAERPARPQRPPDVRSKGRSVAGGKRKGVSAAPSAQSPRQQQVALVARNGEVSDTSETGSQQSATWGEDPEIQEKVRRLNEAKEKLQRLQELVAIVQTSPDGLPRQLPDELAELAASLEGGDSQGGSVAMETTPTGGSESRSRQGVAVPSSAGRSKRPKAAATATEESLSLSGAVAAARLGYSSAGTTDNTEEQPYDDQEAYYQMRMMEQKDELESLMEERKKLLMLQQELQRLHETLPQPNPPPSSSSAASLQAPRVDIGAGDVLNNRSYMQQSPNNRELAGETSRSQRQQPQQQSKAAEAFGVTFQEPLETVITNEELYGRMRQQRMLREELREKKKELEDMMRKDRPKKQYSRNQDNQSDNVSYSNRSEQLFGGSASVDQTMATWGGSTVDNLESIEEDEGNSGDGQEAEECDDGYPSDGIVQVEEEEEQNAVDDNSDDRDTYTIEEEPYVPKGRLRRQQTNTPPSVDSSSRPSSRKKSSGQGAPFQGQESGESYNYWAPDSNQVLNNVRSKSRRKKDSETSALKEELQAVKEQLSGLKDVIASSNRNTPAAANPPNDAAGGFSANLQYVSTLQQQQMLMSLSQVHSQLLNQQQEMGDRLGRLERSFSSSYDTLSLPPADNSPRDASQPHRCSLHGAPYGSDSGVKPSYSMPSFSWQPNFPEGFTYPRLSDDRVNSESSLPTPGYGSLGRRSGPPVEAGTSPAADAGKKKSHNRNNNHIDGVRLETVLQRQAERNPLYGGGSHSVHAHWGGGRDDSLVVRGEGTGVDDPDAVPIETIQAQDTWQSSGGQNSPNVMAREPAVVKPKTRRRSRPKQQQQAKSSSGSSSVKAPSKKEGVVGKRFPTPSRASAAARLASQQVSQRGGYRPAVAGGNNTMETASISSVVSSVPGGEGLVAYPQDFKLEARREPDEAGDYSFEALRETIYAEVATLISQNETRPHYLIEMFQELQRLGTDYLRQRALYAVQELVASYQTGEEDQPAAGRQGDTKRPRREQRDCAPARWVVEGGNSEQTPSMSAFNSEEEEIRALQRIRGYDRRMTSNSAGDEASASAASPRTSAAAVGGAKSKAVTREESVSSSAQDNGSEGSVSDVPYPRIDTQQLDHQIKAIMTEVIPVLREHMEDVCSHQLLQYIKRLVLSLTRQNEDADGQEFGRFFQNQLGSILQDSLSKFDGRKMRDCGEDLLVDLSEILFNELAFFRLMQDLDNPAAKARAAAYNKDSGDRDSATAKEHMEMHSAIQTALVQELGRGEESSSGQESDTEDSSTSGDEERRTDERAQRSGSTVVEKQDLEGNYDTDSEVNEEQENLGKTRDDEMAAQVLDVDGDEEDEDEDVNKPLKIQLAPSETKPMTRIGSDEDDEGEDEAVNYSDISDTAVSHEYGDFHHQVDSDVGDTYTPQPEPLVISNGVKEEKSRGKSYDSDKEEDTAETAERQQQQAHAAAVQRPVSAEVVSNEVHSPGSPESLDNDVLSPQSGDNTVIEVGKEADERASLTPSTKQPAASLSQAMNGAHSVSEDEEIEEEIVEMDSQDTEEEVTIDDLPSKLIGLTKEESSSAASQSSAMATQPVLEYVDAETPQELAGDPLKLKEPGTLNGTASCPKAS